MGRREKKKVWGRESEREKKERKRGMGNSSLMLQMFKS
jgi:hypothetical protein